MAHMQVEISPTLTTTACTVIIAFHIDDATYHTVIIAFHTAIVTTYMDIATVHIETATA